MPENEAQGSLLEADKPVETTSSWFSAENAELVKQRGWNNGDDVIKGYRNVEKMASGMIKVPTPASAAEEVRAFYQKTGCPENPEGYEIAVPEEMSNLRDEGGESAIKQIAYDQGVNKQAFEAIVKGYYDKLSADMVASRESGEKSLKEELGDKYDESLAIARRFCDTCSDEFKQLLEQTGLGNNPIVIKEFLAKGKQTMADTLIKGSAEGEKEEGYVPQYLNSPEQYATGEDDESKKARAFFEARGHRYG